jgi:tetratricopeptide (TPR) repeat protein
MIREHPWLGIGGGSFSCRFASARLEYLQTHGRVGFKRIGWASHFPNAHNDPLQVIAELGVGGLLWMVALGVVLVRIRPWRSLPLGLAMAGLAPFLFFHYPCHIAVTLAPMMILLAMAVRQHDPARQPLVLRRSRWLVFLAVLAIAAAVVWTGIRTVRLDIWRKNANMTLDLVQVRTRQGRLPAKARKMLLGALDMEGTARLGKAPGADAWLWRIIGLTRLGRGDAAGAEAAFRKSLSVCPHEEAYLGLGIALADQGRINEAFPWLSDACRVDPNLAKVIPDPALRQAVMESIGAAK